MTKFLLLSSALSGAVTVSFGAFGTHVLKATLENNGYLSTFETAVSYQFYHTLALLVLATMSTRLESSLIPNAGYAFIAGIVLFSGSLYALSLTEIKWLGVITPLGGLAFIIGWILLLLAGLKM